MKYKYEDFGKLVDVFANISENQDNDEVIYQELAKIVNYPVEVVKVFADSMTQFTDKGEDYLKEHYMSIAGLIIMRMNFADPNFKF